MKTVHNERLKLSATFLNGLAIAVVAIGGITPVVQTFSPIGSLSIDRQQTLHMAAACLIGSAVLHFGARLLLKGLKE